MGKVVDPKMMIIIMIVVNLLPMMNRVMGQRGLSLLGCLKPEREALLKFKASVVYDHAKDLSSWKGDDCCSWYGVTCHNVTHHVLRLDLPGQGYEYQCYDTEIASVSCLSFSELNPSLLELKQLRRLDLSGNDFNDSSIPEFIGSMKHLRYLNLSWGGFSGVVPQQLGNLTRLRSLDLSSNDFLSYSSSNIHWLSSLVNSSVNSLLQVLLSHLPLLLDLRISNSLSSGNPVSLSSIFYSNNFTFTSRIQHLDLSANNLQGPIPLFLSNFNTLTYLDLSRNNFTGLIPPFISNITNSLEFLDLSDNNLGGPIPHFMSNINSLRVLNLGLNQFSHVEGGTIMSVLGNLCHLKTLSLHSAIVGSVSLLGTNHEYFSNCLTYDLEYLGLGNNNITDTLPYWLGKLVNLKVLWLGDNKFYGPIPTSFGNLSLLEELHLGNCSLWGSIPSSIGRLSSLKLLDLGENSLNGSIPSSIWRLSSLQSLDLSSNLLQGVLLDSHFANLSSLKQLDLRFTALNLTLSQIPAFQLNFLFMRSCTIESRFPHWIKMQTELRELDLSDTGIFGEISDWTTNVDLDGLNLSHNHLTGSIPHFLPSSQLTDIDLSNNLLSGPLFHKTSSKNGVVEAPLCQLENLELLHLQRNQLSGTIPDCWGISQEVFLAMDLSFNKLSGSIPMTVGLLPNLSYLKLNNNSLEGNLPATLNQLSQLVILDVGENKLNGEVPNWDAKTHPFLKVLIMRGNQLEGVIPSRLCLLPSLQVLDLALNNLAGSIPSCFGHFKSMNSINSSLDTSLHFALAPLILPSLTLLPARALWNEDIEMNATVVLKGEELEYTTTLMYVVNLDLSSNGLVGSIPEELTNLTDLIGLNLSNNHLTGFIPGNIGEMSSLESLDLSNNNLSGTIPSSISVLTYLISLNLSSNKLHGEIPTGNQLQTLNDPSIYGDNAGLCGDPLPNKCNDSKPHEQDKEEEEEEVESTLEKVMFYIVVMLGFATGFWGVVGSLLYSNTWRHALFRRVEFVTDFLYVQLVVRIKRLLQLST